MSIAPQGGQMHFRGQLAGYPEIDAPKKLFVVPPTGFWSHLRYLTNRPLNDPDAALVRSLAEGTGYRPDE